MLFYLEKTEGVYVNESRSLLLPDNETIINLVNTCRVVKHVKTANFFNILYCTKGTDRLQQIRFFYPNKFTIRSRYVDILNVKL